MGSFFGSLFAGANPTLQKDQNQAGDIAGYGTNTGQSAVDASVGFDKGILSGDPATIAKTLAPEISTGAQEAQQKKATTAEFGNRSGGNNASTNAIDASARGNIINLEGGLQQGAAAHLGQIGTAEQGIGLNANQVSTQDSQMQMQNIMNSIFGKGITSAVNYGESFLPIAHGGE
jgi:hypothetical protein